MAASLRKIHVLVSGTVFLFSLLSLALHLDVTLASAVSAAATSSVDCLDEVTACTSDEDCYTCLTTVTVDKLSDYEECISDISEDVGADACRLWWSASCCRDELAEVDCMANEFAVAYWGCSVESVSDCSVDDLTCSTGSSDAAEGNSGKAEGSSGAVESARLSSGFIVYVVALLGALTVVALPAVW